VLDAFDRSEVSKPVARALSHLLRNYSSAVSVQDLADLSGWSAFQVIRAFRKEPIAGVAVDVGFVDQTHFTRHFKRMHGNTPGNYLKARQVALGEMRGAI
jgi:AraC-like DNA-binding protein